MVRFQVPKAGKTVFHLHFMCPVYIGLDFTVTATLIDEAESGNQSEGSRFRQEEGIDGCRRRHRVMRNRC